MAVYKIFPAADATIYSAYPLKNTGRDSVLEISVKNSQDASRFVNRSLMEQSPYYSYDVAATDNYTNPLGMSGSSDIRRALLQFSNSDVAIIKAFASQSISGSWEAALKLNLAFAQNLNTTYSLEAYAVSQSWQMGTGMYSSTPEIRNGVSWTYTGPAQISTPWSMLGGSWITEKSGSQSFDYMSNKDVNLNVTSIADAWFSGSIPNYGIIVKHPTAIEQSTGSFMDLKFFSVDTHTIYPPCLEIRWDDAYYFPIGSNYILNDQFTLVLSNNPGTFKQNSVYRFRTAARDTFPVRQFTTASLYVQPKYLSQESYWAIQDLKTNEMIIDFDAEYTKLSADSVSNYFTLYMNGLEPERFYRILIKTKIYSTTFGPLSIYDNEQSIYTALSLYSANDLALLPAEEVIVDNNLVFKVIR